MKVVSNCAQLPRACVRPSGRGSECQMWPSFIMDEGGEHEGLGFFFLVFFCACRFLLFAFLFQPQSSVVQIFTASQRRNIADLLMPRL